MWLTMKMPRRRTFLVIVALLALPGCVSIPPLVNVEKKADQSEIKHRLDAIDSRLDRLEQKADKQMREELQGLKSEVEELKSEVKE